MSKNNEYNADQIQVLEGLEAVRVRPGMYIGSTSQKGLHHLVYEIVDNSVDEALAGHCNVITISLLKDDIVVVEDDGRGIPVDKHKKTGLSAAETVYTVLHAGGKFGGDSGYKVSGGLHGVGASVVNALSDWTEVEIKRDGKKYLMKFEKGKTVQSLKKVADVTDGTTGTKVSFKADSDIFETTEYDYDVLSNRLREIAFLTRGLKIVFQDLRDEEKTKKEVYHYEGGIESLVEYLNRNKEKIHDKPIFIGKIDGEVPVEIALQYTKSYTETVLSFVNNINTTDGGTHVEGFRRALTKTVNDYARSKNLLKEKDTNFQGDDVREGVTVVISVKVANPQFESQTKTKLNNSEVSGIVQSLVSQKLGDFLEENPTIAKVLVNKFMLSQRARAAAKRARESVRKTPISDIITLPGKLADCIEKDASKCELYLVEGDSAAGTAKGGRDRTTQAILAMRGKVLNVEKSKEDKVYGNDTIKPIIQSLGTGIGKEFKAEKIRYGKIIIMADADVDGAHIRTLLLTFFFRYMKELIENGNIYLAQPPLYKISKRGMEDKYCYTDKELEKELEALGKERENATIQRYKGLGEMSADQLWETTMNPESRVLIKVTLEDAAYENEMFTLLMGDQVEPRREFIEQNAKSVKNLDI